MSSSIEIQNNGTKIYRIPMYYFAANTKQHPYSRTNMLKKLRSIYAEVCGWNGRWNETGKHFRACRLSFMAKNGSCTQRYLCDFGNENSKKDFTCPKKQLQEGIFFIFRTVSIMNEITNSTAKWYTNREADDSYKYIPRRVSLLTSQITLFQYSKPGIK
jgi:hypothetical protein